MAPNKVVFNNATGYIQNDLDNVVIGQESRLGRLATAAEGRAEGTVVGWEIQIDGDAAETFKFQWAMAGNMEFFDNAMDIQFGNAEIYINEAAAAGIDFAVSSRSDMPIINNENYGLT